MKRLVCEMCGSTDLIKSEGVFVCQSCGCKYSVEEAKKMMVEGVVSVEGTVTVDTSAEKREQIVNYLDMANSAFEGNDITGVVSYCDKVLEIDPKNYEAWVLRAKSAGWDSTLKDPKIPQVITAAKRAIDIAPDTKKYDVAAEIYYSAKLQISALLSIARSMPAGFAIQHTHSVFMLWKQLLEQIPFLSAAVIEEEIKDCALSCSNSKNAMAGKQKVIWSAYYALNHNEPYDVTFKKALEHKIEEEKAREAEFKARAEKTAQEKRDAYWADHQEEKQQLEQRKADAIARKEQLESSIDQIPGYKDKQAWEEKVASLKKKLDSLGLFKKKEKDAINREIASLESKIDETKQSVNSQVLIINEQIEEQSKIIEEVDSELEMER